MKHLMLFLNFDSHKIINKLTQYLTKYVGNTAIEKDTWKPK